MIKGIIFDMDGVLLNTENMHYLAWHQVFLTKDHQLTAEEYARSVQSRSRRDAIVNVLGQISDADISLLSQLKETYYLKMLKVERYDLFEDAKLFLEVLKEKRIPLAIASSSSVALKLLQDLGYDHYFRIIVSGRDVEKGKPDPEIFLTAMRKLGITDPKTCLVMEDSLNGIAGAKNAKMEVVAIDREWTYEHLEGNILRVRNLMEIPMDRFLSEWL